MITIIIKDGRVESVVDSTGASTTWTVRDYDTDDEVWNDDVSIDEYGDEFRIYEGMVDYDDV